MASSANKPPCASNDGDRPSSGLQCALQSAHPAQGHDTAACALQQDWRFLSAEPLWHDARLLHLLSCGGEGP